MKSGILDYIDTFRHKLIHETAGGSYVNIKAEDVKAGTFGANAGNGDYTFPGKVTLAPLAVSDTKLVLYDSGTSTYSLGIRSGTLGYFAPSVAAHRFYLGGIEKFKVDNVAVNTQVPLNVAGNLTANGFLVAGAGQSNPAYIGQHPVHTAWAAFGHNAFANNADLYAFMQMSDGRSYVNGEYVRILTNGTTRLDIQDTGIVSNVYFTINSHLDVNGHMHATSIVKTNTHFDISGTGGMVRWLNFGTQIWAQDSTWIRINKPLYSAGNRIRSDASFSAAHLNGNTGVYLRSDTDTNHRLFGEASIDGVTLTGWSRARMYSGSNDISMEAGNGPTTRVVNVASTVWRTARAANHENLSDPKMKRDMIPIPVQLERVKQVRPVKFKWKNNEDGSGDPNKERFGFNSLELPDEVTSIAYLDDEDHNPTVETRMVDPMGLTAILWEAVLELTDKVEQLERGIANAQP